MSNKASLLFVSLFILLVSCGNQQTALKQQADALCNVFSPEQLKPTENMNLLDTFAYLNQQIQAETKSSEFDVILQRIAEQGERDIYVSLQKEISQLLGEQWHCENAKIFYSGSWRRVDHQEQAPLVAIVLTDEKQYKINNSIYRLSDVEGIKKAIESEAGGESYTIELLIPSSVDAGQLNPYLEPLRMIGVEKLSVLKK